MTQILILQVIVTLALKVLYRLSGGSRVLDRRIVDMRSFERTSGTPETETHTILLPVGAVGPFTLRIFNGSGMSPNGKRVENAVEGGRVWWNGQEIASPNHFGNNIRLRAAEIGAVTHPAVIPQASGMATPFLVMRGPIGTMPFSVIVANTRAEQGTLRLASPR